MCRFQRASFKYRTKCNAINHQCVHKIHIQTFDFYIFQNIIIHLSLVFSESRRLCDVLHCFSFLVAFAAVFFTSMAKAWPRTVRKRFTQSLYYCLTGFCFTVIKDCVCIMLHHETIKNVSLKVVLQKHRFINIFYNQHCLK